MSAGRNQIKVSAPARICLMGEHQDYYGLASITAAIDLRIKITGQPRKDSILSIHLPDINQYDKIAFNQPIVYRGPRDYLRSGLKIMQQLGLSLPCGFDVEISSQIPIAKGISSSSALNVAWITFLAQATGWHHFTKEEIAFEAYRAEVLEFAEAGGMMDHYSSALGGLLHIDCKEPFTPTKLKPSLTGFMLGDSGTTKDTQGVLSSLKSQVLNAVDQLKQWVDKFSFRETSIDEIKPYLKRISTEPAGKLEATLANRDLTRKTFHLLNSSSEEKSNLGEKLGELMNQHHQYLRDGLGISTPIMEKMIHKALMAGALGCKVNGSGGGGFILIFAPGKSTEVTRELELLGAKTIPVSIGKGIIAG